MFQYLCVPFFRLLDWKGKLLGSILKVYAYFRSLSVFSLSWFLLTVYLLLDFLSGSFGLV